MILPLPAAETSFSFAMAEKSLLKPFTPTAAPPAVDVLDDPAGADADDAPDGLDAADDPDDAADDNDDDEGGDAMDDDPAEDDGAPPEADTPLLLPALPLLPHAASTMLAATSAANTAPLFLNIDVLSSHLFVVGCADSADRGAPAVGHPCCRTTRVVFGQP